MTSDFIAIKITLIVFGVVLALILAVSRLLNIKPLLFLRPQEWLICGQLAGILVFGLIVCVWLIRLDAPPGNFIYGRF